MIKKDLEQLCRERDIQDPEFILYPTNGDSLNTIVIIDGDSIEFVLKYSREDPQRVQTLSESLTLVAEELSDTSISNTIPNQIPHITDTDVELLLQQPVDGKLSHNRFSIRKKKYTKELLKQVTDWLLVFHGAFSTSNETEHMERYLPDSLSEEPIIGPMHGDFVTSNVLITKDNNINVIDWEEFTAYGVPIVDLYFFIVDLASALGGEEPFTYAFYEENWFAELAQQQIVRYCQQQSLEVESAKEHIKTYLSYSEELSKKLGNNMWGEKANRLRKEYEPEYLSW